MASASYSSSPDDTASHIQRDISVDEVVLLEEVELLTAIYINEISVEKDELDVPNRITVQLHPATGENADKQYVCLTLILNIPDKYPFSLPEFEIKNPRGLADDHITDIRNGLISIANKQTGSPMLYEMIEFAKENLTLGNLPHGTCVICLQHFEDQDAFIKTECYHYFHCDCAYRYITHSLDEIAREEKDLPKHKQKEEKQVVCPVCREPISYNLDYLRQNSDSNDEELKVEISQEIRQLQKKMSVLLSEQKAKGGIIDLDEEKNKFLVTNEPITVPLSSDKVKADETSENDVGSQAAKSGRKEENGPVKGKGRGQKYRDYDGRRPGSGNRYHRPEYRGEKSYRNDNFSDRNAERLRRNKNRERYRNERSREGGNSDRKELERNKDGKEMESRQRIASKSDCKEENQSKEVKNVEKVSREPSAKEKDSEKSHKGHQEIIKNGDKMDESNPDDKSTDGDKKETVDRERGSGQRGRGHSYGNYRGNDSGRGTGYRPRGRGRGQRGRYSDRPPRGEHERNFHSGKTVHVESQDEIGVKQNLDDKSDTRSKENCYSKDSDLAEKDSRKRNYNRHTNRDVDHKSAGHRRYPRENTHQTQRDHSELSDKQKTQVKPPPGFKQNRCPPGFEKENSSSEARTNAGESR